MINDDVDGVKNGMTLTQEISFAGRLKLPTFLTFLSLPFVLFAAHEQFADRRPKL